MSITKALTALLICLILSGTVSYSLRLFSQTQILGASTTPISLTYPLLEGWNLVHFPLKPDKFSTASELVAQIAKDGGYVTVVATWGQGQWQEYVQRGAITYSPDFPITPGTAYFLRSHRQINWTVTGIPVALPPLQLIPGWNSIGLLPSSGQTASQFLTSLNQNRTEIATEIDWWHSGAWDPFVQRLFSPPDVQEYGENFTLSPQIGYMIKAK